MNSVVVVFAGFGAREDIAVVDVSEKLDVAALTSEPPDQSLL